MDMPTTIPPFSKATPVSSRGQASHPVKSQAQRASRTRRLRYLPTQGRWDEPEIAGLRAGIKLSAAGGAALAAWGIIALLGNGEAALPLSLFGSVLLALGGALLLVALGRATSGRIRRIKRHCGRCRFYQAESGIYSLGRCAAAPGEPAVRRTDTCPSFHFSERAMVRERLSRRPDLLKQIRITRAG